VPAQTHDVEKIASQNEKQDREQWRARHALKIAGYDEIAVERTSGGIVDKAMPSDRDAEKHQDDKSTVGSATSWRRSRPGRLQSDEPLSVEVERFRGPREARRPHGTAGETMRAFGTGNTGGAQAQSKQGNRLDQQQEKKPAMAMAANNRSSA
jgi:hypothetical protein